MRSWKKMIAVCMFSLFLMVTVTSHAVAEWPGNKPITVVIQYKAGGGTDTNTRKYCKLMEEHLGTTVNAINRPGAIGALAMDFVYNKPADGYWWMGGSQFSKPLRVMGHTKLNGWKDWQYFKSNSALASWAVKADSPFKTMEDFLEAARKNPGKYSISNSGVGGIWNEATEILVNGAKIKVRQIPYKGGAPATLACMQGEVDVAGSGLHEQIGFIRAGKLRNLAVFSKEAIKDKTGVVFQPIGDFVPSLVKFAPFGAEHTLGVRRDVPVEILEKIKDAFVAAVNSPEFEEHLKKKYFFKNLVVGEEADRMAAFRESVTSWLFWDLKVAGVKVNPADLGIPRPEDFDKWWPPKGYKPRLK
jgi:tripartite-type tricarboxylate transporter receptor subunit TctC